MMILNIKDTNGFYANKVGNKAYTLNRLFHLGYSVCNGFVLTTDFFEQFCVHNKIQLNSPSITIQIGKGRFHLISQLADVFNIAVKNTGAIIVRSSGVDEDSDDKSYAGIFKSIVDIKSFADMLKAIKTVWISYFSQNVKKYNYQHESFAAPVLIQEMIKCDKSGVLFTRNPVGNRNETIIEACNGHNQKIIDNEEQADANILSATEKRKLDRLARKIEAELGYPCDMEWGMKNKKIYIFQARPIIQKHEKNIYLESVKNDLDCILLDRYANPASVCYLSLLDSWQSMVYLSYYNKKRGEFFDDKPLCFLYNRVYWNVKYQKKHFEVSEKQSWINKLKLYLLIQYSYKNWYKRLPKYEQSIKGLSKKADTANDYNELISLLDASIDNFCCFLGIDHFRFLGLAQNLYKRIEAFTVEKDEIHRIVGLKTNKNKTIQANNELLRLAEMIKRDDELRVLFSRKQEARKILNEWLYRGGDGKTQQFFHRFIREHGHRGVNCDDLYYPHWNEDREKIISLIQQLIKSEVALAAVYEDKKTYIKNKKLKRLANLTGEYMCLRENQRYYFDKSWVLLRKIILKLSGYYLSNQLINDKQDIFHMTIDEIKDGIKYKNYALKQNVIMSRKENYDTQKEKVPPYIIKDSEEVSVQKKSKGESYKVKGISGGIAVGRVKIINSLDDLGDIKKNDIGIVKTFHPSWTPVLKIVSGLIMSYGNMLSHGAVIAREYGIPVVVFNDDATKIFRDGDRVEINGASGRIRICTK